MNEKNKIDNLLATIDDPALKKTVVNILQSKYTAEIRCMSARCKGRIIAHLDEKKNVVATTNNKGMMYLRASRSRLDGNMGFECWCGNDSRLAEAERGIIGSQMPTKKDLEGVASRLPAIKVDNNSATIAVDNFEIRKI